MRHEIRHEVRHEVRRTVGLSVFFDTRKHHVRTRTEKHLRRERGGITRGGLHAIPF